MNARFPSSEENSLGSGCGFGKSKKPLYSFRPANDLLYLMLRMGHKRSLVSNPQSSTSSKVVFTELSLSEYSKLPNENRWR